MSLVTSTFLLLYCLIHFVTGDDFELTVLHTNDIHARIEEFDKYIGSCEKQLNEECFGGMARLYTAIVEIRQEEKNVILIDGGDQFQGTSWYQTYRWRAASIFMNLTRYDAMALGNHEFDDGISGVLPFIEYASFPIVASNMDAQNEVLWPKSEKFNRKSYIIEKGGKRIGIIGYITQDTSWLSDPGYNIKFYDVVDSVKKEVKILQSKGVDILIALGHAGIQVDISIAQQVPEIDIVVGGHSNTFLYNGERPSNERPYGEYPLHFKHSSGTTTLVVQDFAFAKYLGHLKVVFDESGNVKSWSGNPILLDSSFVNNPNISQVIDDMMGPILESRKKAVGRSLVHLGVSKKEESSMGNLFTDAVVKMTQQYPDETRWASITLAIWNSGGIRVPIIKKINETITLEELASVHPFGNTVNIMEIDGKKLKEVFEWSGAALPVKNGKFLQVSGFRVTYAVTNPVGSRVVDLRALCAECRMPVYEPVKDDTIYKVMTPSYILSGGDGYSMLRGITNHPGDSALSILQGYLKKESPVSVAIEGRIKFLEDEKMMICNAANSLAYNYKLIALLAFMYFSVLIF